MRKACARCNQTSSELTLALWERGPNGFRKYPLCPKCVEATEKERAEKLQKAKAKEVAGAHV